MITEGALEAAKAAIWDLPTTSAAPHSECLDNNKGENK